MQKFYTPKSVASLLNVSEFTVRKWIRQGKIEDTYSSFTKPMSKKIISRIESLL